MSTLPPHSARPSYGSGAPTYAFQHRAMARLPQRWTRLPGAALLALALTAGWLLALPWVGLLWGHLFVLFHGMLELPGGVVMTYYPIAEHVMLPVPHLDVPGGLPGPGVFWGTALVTAIGFLGTFFLPPRMTPLTYVLRALFFIQATALLYFGLTPETFPYTLPQYIKGMTNTSLFVISLVPFVLGFTYYLFDFTLLQKLAVTLMSVGHLTLFVPLKYTVHAYVLHTGSLFFMPLLYLVFGVMLDVLLFITIYAWGMSWESPVAYGKTTPIESSDNHFTTSLF